MPTYDYLCKKCDVVEEHIHSMSESPVIKCSDCEEPMDRQFSVNATGFIMKGGSPSTHWKEKRLRAKKSEVMAERQKKYGTGHKAVPNIAGVETNTWSDAQKMAKEAGMNHESFTPWVEKEKKEKRIILSK